MAKPENDTPYYAIKSSEQGSSTTGGKYSTSLQTLTIGSVSVSDITDQEKITCSTSVQVDLSGTMVGYIKEGDMLLNISNFVTGVSDVDVSKQKGTDGGFFTYQGTSNDEKTATATFTGTISLTGTNGSQDVTANLQLINKKQVGEQEDNDLGNQNYLAGKSLTATFTISVSDCKVEAATGD